MSEDKPGYRDDTNKIQYSLLPTDALAGVVAILTHGAAKYAPRNWEKGMAWSRCFNSLCRHLFKWWSGEDLDPDSGQPHIDHVVCNAMFLAAYAKRPELAAHDDREAMGRRDQRALIEQRRLNLEMALARANNKMTSEGEGLSQSQMAQVQAAAKEVTL